MGSEAPGDGGAQGGGQQDGLSELGTVFRLEALAKAMAEWSLRPQGKGFIFISLMPNRFKT